MPSALDFAIFGLAAFVAVGTVYIAIYSITPESWPEGTPAYVAEGCRSELRIEWCTSVRALAWGVAECAEAGEAGYGACVEAEFAERGGNRNVLSSDLWPAFWGKDAVLWDLVGDLP